MRITFDKLHKAVWPIVIEAVKLCLKPEIRYHQNAIVDGKSQGCRYSISSITVNERLDIALFVRIEESELEINQDHEKHVVELHYSAAHKKLFDTVFNDLAELQIQYPNIRIKHEEIPADAPPTTPKS